VLALERVLGMLRDANKPVFVIGSQTVLAVPEIESIANALDRLGVPVFLAGGARGLLGHQHPNQYRHKRTQALKQADFVLVAGFPLDFRLNYGQAINRKAKLVTVNLDEAALSKNRRPTVGVHAHPGRFVQQLSARFQAKPERWADWHAELQKAERAREQEIAEQAQAKVEGINPIDFFLQLEPKLADDSVLVVDGGDFVATASYILSPRRPLSWLDPGVFGTLGVGGGFALAAAKVRPDAEVWLIYGDGSSAYSLAEFDTYVRHGLAPIAVVGNDGAWAQIAREQVEMLGDACGTELRRTAYHTVAEGYGGVGLLLEDPAEIEATIDRAKELARAGKPVLINVMIGATDFRKGSISM
ncbi:MAG: thiamine pyrophosphate-binding protein, partial [Deltaproteobacteria bacterium]|nr:thiamine pyrophosphate-binding protein [Deltaproteobacteria bacterium]